MPARRFNLNPSSNDFSSRQFGFTMVELLVTIGIMVILASLLMPSLALARRAARQAECASNMRQWTIAVIAYAQQNNNWLPRRGQGKMPNIQLNFYDDWFNELPPFLTQHTYLDLTAAGRMPQIGDKSIWICPELYGSANSSGYLFGYGMNMALSVRNDTYPDRMDKIGNSSTMVFMADGPTGYSSTVPFISTAATPALFNPVPRHNGNVNIAFLDGHVGAFTSKYVGCNVLGDQDHPDACNHNDLRWYWYVPGPFPSPWPGP